MRLRWQARAVSDVQEIFDYIRLHNLAAAKTYTDQLFAAASNLIDFPLSGLPRPDIREGLRSVRMRSHRLYYRVVGDEIRILRVVHLSRDLRSLAADHDSALD